MGAHTASPSRAVTGRAALVAVAALALTGGTTSMAFAGEYSGDQDHDHSTSWSHEHDHSDDDDRDDDHDDDRDGDHHDDHHDDHRGYDHRGHDKGDHHGHDKKDVPAPQAGGDLLGGLLGGVL